MAKQGGIIPIKGTIGNITFFKSKDGFLVRQKGGATAGQIASDPAYKRTRENNAEFGRSCKSGKLMRSAFGSLLQNVSDGKMVGRLVKKMMEVIHADATSKRGQRNVIDGEAELLQDFDFNTNAVLNICLKANCISSIDRTTGVMNVSIPSYITEKELLLPGGATHYKILIAGSEVDFENNQYQTETKSTEFFDGEAEMVDAQELSVTLPANSKHPLFLAMGIAYYQESNGGKYPINNGAFNALKIVRVDGGV